MKLSLTQRKVLTILHTRPEPQTAAMLGVRTVTLRILRRYGCVEAAAQVPNAKSSATGVSWRLTEKGRREAGR